MWKPEIREKLLQSLKLNRKNQDLPANIYDTKSCNGIYVKIQINGVKHMKYFNYSNGDTLEDAKIYLDEIKRNNL